MCSPPSLLCPPLPPSAFPVPPSAAVMATGVSRAMAEPPLIGGCQAGRMEAWAALRCSQVKGLGGWSGGQATPRPHIPPADTLARLQGSPGQGNTVWAGGVSVFSWWAAQPGCLPGCAGDRVTPGTQPWTQGHFKGPLVAACSVGKQLRAGPRGAESSREVLQGRGCCGETALEGIQSGRWGLSFTSGLSIPEITPLLPSPPGSSAVGLALGQVGRPGQGRGSVSRGDQSSCALGNSLDQQT